MDLVSLRLFAQISLNNCTVTQAKMFINLELCTHPYLRNLDRSALMRLDDRAGNYAAGIKEKIILL